MNDNYIVVYCKGEPKCPGHLLANKGAWTLPIEKVCRARSE